MGLVLEAPPLGSDPRVVYLWPQNIPAWNLWMRVQTQWHCAGMDGRRTGLDYAGVQACMGLAGIPRKLRAEVFALLQAMEGAALDEWARAR